MVSTDIDEEQAKAQIKICEGELIEAESDGIDTKDAEPTLRLARAFLRDRNYEKAFLHAVRARRMTLESRLEKVIPHSKTEKIKHSEKLKKK